LIVRIEQPTAIARGSLLGNKDTEDIVNSKRYVVSRIIPEDGVGRFGIRPHQNLPKNAFISLPVLQKTLASHNRVNTILLSSKQHDEASNHRLLGALLDRAMRFEDLGLWTKFIRDSSTISIESRGGIMPPHVSRALQRTLDRVQLQHMTVFTYLANSIEAHGRRLPYSTVSSLQLSETLPFGGMRSRNGNTPAELLDGEIILNQWAADDLQVQPGDSVRLAYYVVGPREALLTAYRSFAVTDVVRMEGLGADSTLTPQFPGMSETDNMAGWQPPFPVDLSWIRSKDESYWDKYRAAPKAFIARATGSRLWGSRYGEVTSVRILPPPEQDIVDSARLLEKSMLTGSSASMFGFEVVALREQGLAASGGATDFSGLFIGFSFFLIVSAILLVALLFRLSVELRAKEVGLLYSLGYPQKTVLRQFLSEGALLSIFGSGVGIVAAMGYAWLIMAALRTWWIDAVGSPLLSLHVTFTSLLTGFAISIFTILLAIWLVLRKLHRLPTSRLLMGITSGEDKPRARRFAGRLAVGSLVVAAILAPPCSLASEC
jgi:hypothetical protein